MWINQDRLNFGCYNTLYILLLNQFIPDIIASRVAKTLFPESWKIPSANPGWGNIFRNKTFLLSFFLSNLI